MAAELALDTTPPPGGALYPCGWCVKGTRVRTWSVCVSALCLAGLLAACGEVEEGKDPIDWAIDPGVTGEQREILRAALKVVVAECPALADIDWEAEVKKPRHGREDGDFWPARFIEFNPQDVNTQTFIDGWTHYGRFMLRPERNSHGWYIDFSWTEPAGITADSRYSDPREDIGNQRICGFNERRTWKGAWFYWFKRVDALAGVVAD